MFRKSALLAVAASAALGLALLGSTDALARGHGGGHGGGRGGPGIPGGGGMRVAGGGGWRPCHPRRRRNAHAWAQRFPSRPPSSPPLAPALRPLAPSAGVWL